MVHLRARWPLFVDGQLDAEGVGSAGDVGYPDNQPPTDNCGFARRYSVRITRWDSPTPACLGIIGWT
ncbi:MAG: hypothetical protein ACE5LU_18535 [Anaerolineae bacterium]